MAELTLEDIEKMKIAMDKADIPRPYFVHVPLDMFCGYAGMTREEVLAESEEIEEGIYKYGQFTLYD